MKTLHLITIIVSVFFISLLTSHVYAQCNVVNGTQTCVGMNPILNSIQSDKSLYENSDKPVITIFGLPHSLEYLEINNQSGNIVFSHSIELPSTGIANFTLDISSYKLGIYSAVAHTSTSKVSTTFTVGHTLSSAIMSAIKPPLQQFKSGTAIQDITCSKTDGKQTYLFLRAENHDPVCITSNAEDKLSRRGFIETNQTVINQIVLKKAREFVLSSDTFENHGIKDSLSLDLKTCDLIVPQSCYPQAYFQINSTGSYGNGTDSIPITSTKTSYHVMSMTILGMNHVQCAVVDGVWDEKNQKPLDKNDPLCGMWYGYKDGTG